MATHSKIPKALDQFLVLSRPLEAKILKNPVARVDVDEKQLTRLKSEVVTILECSDGGWSSEAIFTVKKSLEIKLHLGEVTLNQWLIIRTLHDILHETPKCKTFDETASWQSAIRLTVNAINANWFRHTLIENSRERVVAKAVQSIRRRGFRVSINGYGPQFCQSEYKRFCKRIEKSIIRLGGRNAASYILASLNKSGKIKDGYISHARSPSTVSTSPREAGIPWHYLYSLALKHLDTAPKLNEHNSHPEMEELVELGRILTATIDCEPHSAFENISLGHTSFAKTINETLVYDELFAFPQWHAKISLLLLNSWIEALTKEGITFPVATASDWKLFAERLVNFSGERELRNVRPVDLCDNKLPSLVCEELFKTCATPSVGVNNLYLRPSDTKKRNSCYFPIIRQEKLGLIVQPKGMIARAIWERLYAKIRELSIPKIDNKLGDAFELLAKTLIINGGNNVTFHGEKYQDPNGQGKLEVDLVVETDERIFLIECKKKVLTNDSRKGDTISSFTDFDKSFLALIQQLVRHESNLRQNGEIQFLSGHVLKLEGRKIEKIGLSLFDHGSIQYRGMTMALMNLLFGRNISFDATESKDLESSMNTKLNSISTNLKLIQDNSSSSNHGVIHDYAMSSWWLSIDQLAFALDQANGDLWDSLKKVRHISTGSGDFIYDLQLSRNLNPVAQAMEDASSEMNAHAIL